MHCLPTLESPLTGASHPKTQMGPSSEQILLESRQIGLLEMSAFFNVGRWDRVVRLVVGIALGVSAIFVDGHPYARWGLTLGGIAVILSGTCGI